jgi:hypothetical protein
LLIAAISGDALAGLRDALDFGAGLNLGIFGEAGRYSALFMFAVLCFFLVRRSLRKVDL